MEGGDWNRLPSLGSRSHRGSARRFMPSPSPTLFRHSSRSSPLPPSCDHSLDSRLVFPLSSAPARRRLGAHSFELRNNEPRGPATPRAPQLRPCPSRTPRRRRLTGIPHLRPVLHCGPTSDPLAHTRGVEVKLSWAAPAPRRPRPPPRSAPSPHQVRPHTAQPDLERSPPRLSPAPVPENPPEPRLREAQVSSRGPLGQWVRSGQLPDG